MDPTIRGGKLNRSSVPLKPVAMYPAAPTIPVKRITARLVETTRFVAIPIPSTIKGTITTPPPTPTSPESAP
jgi:hypothetical protein